MTPDLFRKLAALGLSTEQMAGVLEIMEAATAEAEAKDEARKANGRERWRRWSDKRKPNVSKREQTLANNSREGVTRVEDISSNLEITVKKEIKKDGAPAARTPLSNLETVLDSERAQAVVDHRQRLRKPLTAHAAKLLADKLGQAPSPNDAADTMIANGWQGFDPSWLDNRTARHGTGPPGKPDPVDDLATYLERHDASRQTERNHPVVELFPPNRDKQAAVAGHIRAAVGRPFD